MQKDLFKYAANPNEAENTFHDFCKEYKNNHHKDFIANKEYHSFLKIFGNTRFLTQFIINNTWTFEQYQNSPFREKEKPFEQFVLDIKNITKTHAQPTTALKKYKYQEFIRITIKELLGYDQRQTYREISHLAYAIVPYYLTTNVHNLCQKYSLDNSKLGDFALMALGKLGGYELNYSSDIDLIGLYSEDKEQNTVSNHQFFNQLFSQTGRDLALTDRDGFFFRVDWDLRPEGRSGVLANSISAMERYYQTFGEEWERQAYIKASVLYHKQNLGDELIQMLKPFVYRKYFDEKTIHNIWNMRARMTQERQNAGAEGISIKLDDGGIRDIEFFIQGFQLLYGGKITALQNTNTLEALDLLAQHSLINTQTKNTLLQSYLFLRRIETCLQMENEQQTHILKTCLHHKLKVARRMGITHDVTEAIAILEERLFNVRNAVTRIFKDFYTLQ
jgi:[glutamine synthetase] adenylyltransferase / [glutamine synthetase]-adenylyl-L-tyrosine phosphorylase